MSAPLLSPKKESKEEKKESKDEVEPPPEEEEDDYDDFIERDFSKWVNNKRLADCVFVVGSKRELIWGHRQILAAGSEVFASMLYPSPALPSAPTPPPNPNLKDVSGIPKGMVAVEIKDVEPEMFKILINCLYTNHATIEIEQVGECMKLSQKYCVEKLAGLCGVFLDKGISIDNAIQMFESAPRLLGDPDFGFDFMAENATEIFALPDFGNLSKPRLLHLIQSSELKIKELDVWKAVIEWGKAECKRQEKKEGKDELKAVLAEIIPHVRFPLMSVSEFSANVTPQGILPGEDVLKLFTYIAQKDAKAKTLPSVPYSDEPRKGGGTIFDFTWSRCGTRGSITSGVTFYSTSSGYCCTIGNTVMKRDSGQYYWEIKIDSMASGDWQTAIGVATSSLNLDNYLSASTYGWAYCGQGCRAYNSGSSSDRWGETYTTGDTIGVLYDSSKGTLSYYKNKRSLGQAYSTVTGDVYPAVQLNSSGRVTIVKGARKP